MTNSIPLIEKRVHGSQSAIAVVKWYHRRAVVTLASHMPSLQRIYAVSYEPSLGYGSTAVTRDNWHESARQSIEREATYMHQLLEDGVDVLTRSESGWIRSAAPPSAELTRATDRPRASRADGR